MQPKFTLCKSFALILFACLGAFPLVALASYQPGQTLNPGCPPSDNTCVVVSSVSTATSTDFVSIAAWGDSLTYGIGGASWPSALSVLTSHRVLNEGFGGDYSSNILSRFNAAPYTWSWPTIIMEGYNDITFSIPNASTTIEANVASMVANLTTSHYLVLSILNTNNEGSGTTFYSVMTAVNSHNAITYGSHYLDVRSYLVSQYNPASPADVTAHNEDRIPPSLLWIDSVHLNDKGYSLVANYINNNIAPLGLTSYGSQVLTLSNLGSLSSSIPTAPWLDTLTGYRINGEQFVGASSTIILTTVGSRAGQSLLSFGSSTALYNTAIGDSALTTATDTFSTTAVGAYALYNASSGSSANTAIGASPSGGDRLAGTG